MKFPKLVYLFALQPWFSLEPATFAAQITLLEHDRFVAVKAFELAPEKGRPSPKSIEEIAHRFNEVHNCICHLKLITDVLCSLLIG